jgi:hypothetical protein
LISTGVSINNNEQNCKQSKTFFWPIFDYAKYYDLINPILTQQFPILPFDRLTNTYKKFLGGNKRQS